MTKPHDELPKPVADRFEKLDQKISNLTTYLQKLAREDRTDREVLDSIEQCLTQSLPAIVKALEGLKKESPSPSKPQD